MENNLLVLGASSDLALSLLPEIAGNYKTIFAHYHRSGDKLQELSRALPDMRMVQADFSDEEETKRMMEQVAETGVNITHILHCPSARVEYKHFRKLTWDEYTLMLHTQLRSLYYASQQFVPKMAKQKYGKIVTVLSSATVGTPPVGMNAYTTAKYSLLGFMKSLAAEYADKNIQINAVSPSMMETKFVSGLSHLVVEKNSADHPLGRNASVNDVAPAIKFLLSSNSDFITGQNLLVSGGSVI